MQKKESAIKAFNAKQSYQTQNFSNALTPLAWEKNIKKCSTSKQINWNKPLTQNKPKWCNTLHINEDRKKVLWNGKTHTPIYDFSLPTTYKPWKLDY